MALVNDGATTPNRRFVSEVVQSLTELGQSKWIGVTLEALNTIRSFEGARLDSFARSTIEAIMQSAQRSLDKEEYEYLSAPIQFESLLEEAQQSLDWGDESIQQFTHVRLFKRNISRAIHF